MSEDSLGVVCEREAYQGGGSPSPRSCEQCGLGPCQRQDEQQSNGFPRWYVHDGTKDSNLYLLEQQTETEGEAFFRVGKKCSHRFQNPDSDPTLRRISKAVAAQICRRVLTEDLSGFRLADALSELMQPESNAVQLEMLDVLSPGVWVVAFSEKRHSLVEIFEEKKLGAPVPAAKISAPIAVKNAGQQRRPKMPDDYNRQVFYKDSEDFDCFDVSTALLIGFDPVRNVFILFDEKKKGTRYSRNNEVWIVDEKTE